MWSPWGKKSVVNSVKNRNISSISLYIYHIITLVQYKWSRGRSLSITVTDKAFFIFSKGGRFRVFAGQILAPGTSCLASLLFGKKLTSRRLVFVDKHILFPFWSKVDQSTLRCVPAQGRQVGPVKSPAS